MKFIKCYCKNPLKTYNKIKKYFKSMDLKVRFVCYYDKWCAKIFDIYATDVMWKDKYNSPRHEHNPIIVIHLFSTFHLYIEWVADDGMYGTCYWEAALNWLYFNMSLNEAIKDSTGWTRRNKETGKDEEIQFILLREPWQTLYNNNELPNIYYDKSRSR